MNEVLKGCQGGLNGVSRVFQEVSSFKSVYKSFKGISQMFQGYFKEDRRVFQGSFMWFSWALERISKDKAQVGDAISLGIFGKQI